MHEELVENGHAYMLLPVISSKKGTKKYAWNNDQQDSIMMRFGITKVKV